MKKFLLLSTSLTAYTFLVPSAFANPEGGVVSAGSAAIESSAGRVDVRQSSDKAVIDWRSFNINKDETTQFHQPSSSSLTVNRINDSNPSRILGNLSANGNVVLINQSGISFGPDAVVDVNSLVATTSDISNADAMAGRLDFQATGSASASIVNEGTITAREAGLVGLVAPTVENRGVINARLGKVHLASGDRFTVDLYGDGALTVAASDAMQTQLVKQSGTINAEGGVVQISAAAGAQLVNSLVQIDGEIHAPSAVEQNGKIVIAGNEDSSVSISGTLDASGSTGGNISVAGKNILQQGTIKADGHSGRGGTVDLSFRQAYLDSEGSKVSAKSLHGEGGHVAVKGKSGSRAFVSGTYDVSSSAAKGGKAQITTDQGDLKLFGAHVIADGTIGGGEINIGGAYQGGGALEHSLTTAVNYSTLLSADATGAGDGGQIIVWSDQETQFAGGAQARGGLLGGDGGLIELSSKDQLKLSDAATPTAAGRFSGYSAGQLLLDPRNITISNAGLASGVSYFELVDPHADSGRFGYYDGYRILPNGNVVVTDDMDDLMATNSGAAYLFNGATGALISTLTGTQADDRVGYSVKVLDNGNYLVISDLWNNGGMADVGAVTWGSKATGISGSVSAANSLVGAFAGETLSYVRTLTNGNYLVIDTTFSNGAINLAGAVAWANGNGGTVGVLSAANALVGTTFNDRVGSSVELLSNGNYVVRSSMWDNGGIVDAGAVTWGNGNGGTVGTLSAANSLVGSHANDYIGNSFAEFSNGNFLVGSNAWDDGAVADVGAVTFVNGSTGLTGALSAANSLVGSTTDDLYGGFSLGDNLIELGNGNFVLSSPDWDDGAVADVGAVTIGSTTTGLTGAISAANSLIGSTTGDRLGSGVGGYDGLYDLGNGNFLVSTPTWDDGATIDVGAVTWLDGSSGLTGTVSAANSLIGQYSFDSIGSGGVLVLGNGNYVVGSPLYDGALMDVGAATWGSGAAGVSGVISSANSLVGTNLSDGVSYIAELESGNYVAGSSVWDDGAVADVGAVALADGTTGLSGFLTSAISIIGSTAGDQVGAGGVVSVGTNNFIVLSPYWDNGGIVDSGAATWMQESSGTHGVVSTANSLYSLTADSSVGSDGAHQLANGHYLVFSSSWDDGAIADAGAVTWGNGNTGITGAITSSNSLVGGSAGDLIGSSPSFSATYLPNGNYLIMSTSWDNGAATDAGAVTWGNGNTGVTGVVSALNSVVGTQTDDWVGWEDWYLDETILDNSNYILHAIFWDNGAISDAGAVVMIDGTYGTVGEISSVNAILGHTANASAWPHYAWTNDSEDHVNGRYIAAFSGDQKVYSIDIDGNRFGDYDSYTDMSALDVNLSPVFITNVLNAGTSVTLQASNDITLDDDLVTVNNLGIGGDLTFQAGRSILLNANIDTDSGDLNLFANEDLATGLVNAQRLAGSAVITMAAGTSINAGSGAVNIRLDDGTGKTNSTAGNITLRDITADTVLVRNMNNAGDVVLQSGAIQANGTGTALTIASKRNFINNSGAAALNTPNGRWLVYSTNPANDTLNSLASDFRRFSCTYGASCPALGLGNGLLYSYTPTLTITPTALAALTYGDAAPNLVGYAYSASGYLGSDSGDDVLGGSLTGTTTYAAGSNAGSSYNISYSSGSLTSDMGYGFTYANNASAITVNKKDLTATFIAGPTKTYGNANPTLSYANFNFTGLYGADSASLFTTVTPNYGAVDANTDVGAYAISAAIGATTNYTVSVDPTSTLTINARPLSVVTHSKSKILPAADPVFTGGNNLTAHDAALVSWAYAPLAYAGLDGTYTIAASATDPSSRLSNYTRSNTYGTFTVHPVGTASASAPVVAAPVMPDTVRYMSLGGFLRDAQAQTGGDTTQDGGQMYDGSFEISGIEAQLATPEADQANDDLSVKDRNKISIHPRLKEFLTNPFAMLLD